MISSSVCLKMLEISLEQEKFDSMNENFFAAFDTFISAEVQITAVPRKFTNQCTAVQVQEQTVI